MRRTEVRPGRQSVLDRWIIVGGCPRSGTTLLGNALGAADGVIVTPEAQFASDAFRALTSGRLAPATEDIIGYLINHWRYRIWNDPVPTDWPDVSACRDKHAVCARLISHIVRQHARLRGCAGATVWVDHTPEHLGRSPDLVKSGIALSAVHLIRDGRGVAASMRGVDWGPRDAAALAHWWLAQLAQGLAAEQCVATDTCVRAHFEDLVADPARSLETICDALDLSFSSAMLSSRALKLVAYTQAQHRAVGLKADQARATAWQQCLGARDQEVFEHIAGDALAMLGYPLGYSQPRPRSRMETLIAHLQDNAVRRRMVKWRRRRRRTRSLASA
ncbi:MAG: sulfotransferase [Pseudomonadota bacterium]